MRYHSDKPSRWQDKGEGEGDLGEIEDMTGARFLHQRSTRRKPQCPVLANISVRGELKY